MQPDDHRVLGLLEVSGQSAPVESVSAHLAGTLIEAAEAAIADADVRNRVIAQLSDSLQLSAFEWHEPVLADEVTGHQTALMSIVKNVDDSFTLSVDGTPFDHRRIDRTLTLGDVEEWTVSSNLGNHPFHIHVNPFQVVAIRDGAGRDVTVEGSEAFDPDYAGMPGGWRDTLVVKKDHTVTLRTRYQRFVGDFVLHCHIASHGDAGMMQHIRVAMPDDHHVAGMEH